MQLQLLQSKAFIFSLLLVLVNDFILKYNFPCWLTGKLSDFAGLFVFAVFWISFFPKKRNTIVWATAIIFAWWKSPLSQPLIECWNEEMFYSIGRVVDYSDLMALIVLPLAWIFCKKDIDNVTKFRVSPAVMTGVSFFVFCSTSAIEPPFYEFPNPQVFAFQVEIDSAAIFEKEIYIGEFEEDSNNVFRLKNNNKIFFSNQGYRYDLFSEQNITIGDNILLVKKKGTEYYGRHNGFKTNSGRTLFFEKLKIEKQLYLDNYLNQKLEMFAEPTEFSLEENHVTRNRIAFKFFPIQHEIIDSTFQISTNQFGQLEIFNFKNSILDGKYTRFLDSTKIEILGFYEQGLETGTWDFFDSLGVKIREEIYEQGELTEIIHIKSNEKRMRETVVTQKKVVRIHTILLILFMSFLLSSFYFFKKLYQPLEKIPEEKKGFQDHFFRLFGGFGSGFLVSFFVWIILAFFIFPIKTWHWDFPLDLMYVLVYSPFIFLLSSLYFLLSNRIKDIVWIIIWIVLVILIYAEIQYLVKFC